MKKLIFFVLSFSSLHMHAVTLVYNMKIRRVFNVSAILGKKDKPVWIATALPIAYTRSRHIVDPALGVNVYDKRIAGGSLFNLRYIGPQQSWWFEITTGLEKERVQSHGTTNICASRLGIDDIILSGGRAFFPNKKTQYVVYGLAGFPTRRKLTLAERYDTLVGTRFFGLGLGAEASYAIIQSVQQSLIMIGQARFVHFFNRKWYPILPCNAQIEPGNLTDILASVQYRRGKNIFETGYNVTLFSNQAVVVPPQKITTHLFIRQSAYATYSRMFKEFPVLKIPLLLGAGFNIGHAQRFNTKIYAYWLNISTAF
jgi:hypothetical protein